MTTGQEGSLSTGHANTPPDMLRRLETMILMTGYELPMRAIREQIASAVDVIVHTARLRDGSRKIVSITEIYGVEDDDILTQEIFRYEQTGVDANGKIEGYLKPTGIRPTFMPTFQLRGVELPEHEYGIPPADPSEPVRRGKARWGIPRTSDAPTRAAAEVGKGRAVNAGGMVYVSSVGPIKPDTGEVVSGDLKLQTRQCMENLQAVLEEHGSSTDEIVWANWSLRNSSEFDQFYEEWLRWFPDDAPVGQGTLMPLSQRRAGFRVSIGVIAAEQAATQVEAADPARIPAVISVQRPGEAAVPASSEQAPAGGPPEDEASAS
jgi:pilus assembly protein CpaF